MKKLKIRGITGMPLFLTRFHGFLDGKRKAVAFEDNAWAGHYLQKKEAIYAAFLHRKFRELEERTAPLHKESAALAVEYTNVKRRLQEPDETPSGPTQSARDRSAARIAGVKPALKTREQAIEVRMSSIEEELIRATSEAAAIQREAESLLERRVHAYLHGATLANRHVFIPVQYTAVAVYDGEEDYERRHAQNDEARRAILTGLTGGVQNGTAI